MAKSRVTSKRLHPTATVSSANISRGHSSSWMKTLRCNPWFSHFLDDPVLSVSDFSLVIWIWCDVIVVIFFNPHPPPGDLSATLINLFRRAFRSLTSFKCLFSFLVAFSALSISQFKISQLKLNRFLIDLDLKLISSNFRFFCRLWSLGFRNYFMLKVF